MSHRNHVSWPDKEVRLRELDMLRIADKLRRSTTKRQFSYCSSFGRWCALWASSMARSWEAKFFLNLPQQILVRLVQPNPYKSVFVFELFADVRNLHSRHAQALGVGGAINYSRTILATMGCGQSRGLRCLSAYHEES